MMRVGFMINLSKSWMGGVNYYKNLFYALNKYHRDKLELYIFVPNSIDKELLEIMAPYITKIIYTDLLDRNIKYYFWKFVNKYFKSGTLIENYLKRYNIDVVSHSGIIGLKKIKTINWIPDFQHLHLPDMFSDKEIKSRNKSYFNIIKNSNIVILSSYDAKNDFDTFAPLYKDKGRVLQFVSQPSDTSDLLQEKDILEKYKLKKDFFYIPNQFWKHKNHTTVLEGAKILKEKKIDFQIVFSGYMKDYRNQEHVKHLFDLREKYNLEKEVLFLGLIPYSDVFALMKYSKAVINPSLFEGWSSTVEECKSLHKSMILSNISIHKEQYPDAIFFDSQSAEDLAEKMKDFRYRHLNIESSETRTRNFSDRYFSILEEVLNLNEDFK